MILHPILATGDILCVQIRGHHHAHLYGCPTVQFLPECGDTDTDGTISVRLMDNIASFFEILLTKVLDDGTVLE